MTHEQIQADLKKLKDLDPEQTKWVVWPLDKLIWIYEQLANNKTRDTVK